MAERVHPLFQASNKLGEELFEAKKEARKGKGVPFGMEALTAAQDRHRMETEGPEYRRKALLESQKQHGVREGQRRILDMMRGTGK